jgi:hypothetical protein
MAIPSNRGNRNPFEGLMRAMRGSAVPNYIQQQSITKRDISRVYGGPDDFFEALEVFEEKYYKAISNSANIAKGKSVNADLMRKSGRINLNLLNRNLADELMSEYRDNVLRLSDMMAAVGMPGISRPSANLYRSSYEFAMSELDGNLHPAQIALNRSVLSFNSSKVGIDSLSVGRGNILGSTRLRQLASRDVQDVFPTSSGRAMRVLTFDVETTGVYQGAQVRSMSAAEMVYDPVTRKFSTPTVVDGMNLAFESPHFGGRTVSTLNGGTTNMTEFLAQAEFGKSAKSLRASGQLNDMGEGGIKYLDKTEKFIRQLLEADAVAGHNIFFDIDMMIDTAQQQSGFGRHKGIQTAIDDLYERINKGDFLIDTLESTRAYLANQVDQAVEASNITDAVKRGDRFVNNLFSNDYLATIHKGGNAAPYSVENIALNTNLFELIEKDGQAEELFDKITKGSHIAETDVHLQSYVARYVQSGELKIWADAGAGKKSQFGDFARARTLQSQAVTLTTNISDVNHISKTVLNHLETAEGNRRVSMRISAKELGLTVSDLKEEQGILRYSEGAYRYFTGYEQSQIVDRSIAESVIQSALADAQGAAGQTIQVGNSTRVINNASNSIVSLGITYGTLSNATETAALRGINVGLANGQIGVDALTEAFGSVYRNFGTTLSVRDQLSVARGGLDVALPFAAGLGDYGVGEATAVAKAFAAIGDPFSFNDMNSRVFSTVMAHATSQVGRSANAAALQAGREAAEIAFSAVPEAMSELGIMYARAGTGLRIFGDINDTSGNVVASRAIAPMALLKEAMIQSGVADSIDNVGFSFAPIKGEDTLNLFYDVGRSMGRDSAGKLAESLFDIMQDDDQITKLLGNLDGEGTAQVRNSVNAARALAIDSKSRTKAIEDLTESLFSKGIVFGTLNSDDVDIDALRISLSRLGVDVESDSFLQLRAAVLDDAMGEYIALGPSVDVDAAKINETMDELTAARRGSKEAFNKIGEAVVENQRRVRGSIARGVLGRGSEAGIADFYITNKPKIGAGLLGLAAAGAGYYISKKYRERSLYNETLEQQPYEMGRGVSYMNDSAQEFIRMNSIRKDPLATAGVVGNLDRNKVNHTQMGNGKYNHLFGG